MWHAMRIMLRFTAADICRTASAKIDNVRRYLQALAAHGFVREDKGYTGGKPGALKSFSLVRNPGPNHPMICDRCGKSVAGVRECCPPKEVADE
jgi:Fe2+ or Zn2+ uptake regulation protein